MAVDLTKLKNKFIDVIENVTQEEFEQWLLTKTKPMAQQTLQEIKDLAERMWEGCDGCDETDKQMWISGFVKGFLIGKSE